MHSPDSPLVPELDYRKRIKTEDRAEKYTRRRDRKHQGEMRLVERALATLPAGATVLDAPCGNGRMTILLARRGFAVTGADLSEHTLSISRLELEKRGLQAPIERQDLEHLSYPDNAFDCALCFRFFHHLPNPDVRRRVVAELCRVTRNVVLLSYLSPLSPTSLKRRLRQAAGGKRSVQHITSLSEVRGYFAGQGFRLTADLAQLRFLHSLHLARFEAGALGV